VKKGLREERGVEPLAMQIFAGIILLVIGLGIGYAVFTWAGKGTQQALSFSVSVSPNSTTIVIPATGDNTKNLNVTVNRIGAYDKTVTLIATGQPTGVTVSFSPASGIPGFGSTMTVEVDNRATSGTTTLTIKATGTDGVEQVATLELTLV
jgi:aminopeptidase S